MGGKKLRDVLKMPTPEDYLRAGTKGKAHVPAAKHVGKGKKLPKQKAPKVAKMSKIGK